MACLRLMHPATTTASLVRATHAQVPSSRYADDASVLTLLGVRLDADAELEPFDEELLSCHHRRRAGVVPASLIGGLCSHPESSVEL
ncbi:hypothetical protein BU16DRAFT_531551 [Lophium mytilinum]|uniref:Uncharacterized protein n=1 Tax=Lophium mytilinum TaxID=390894 RepID=A0A6A6Q9Q3_9PEZI|nr:hypothetical protein BU16DRAFT_531551 [Lophium mytilinum]